MWIFEIISNFFCFPPKALQNSGSHLKMFPQKPQKISANAARLLGYFSMSARKRETMKKWHIFLSAFLRMKYGNHCNWISVRLYANWNKASLYILNGRMIKSLFLKKCQLLWVLAYKVHCKKKRHQALSWRFVFMKTYSYC